MAKPTKHAPTICIVLTIIAALGIVAGLMLSEPQVIVAVLLPTVIYQVYRTEGPSTRWASWALLGLLAVEALLLLFHVTLDLGAFLGYTARNVAGYEVPVGDIKVVGPAVMAVLALILMARTRGKFTKWLAAIILVTSFGLIFTIDRTVFLRWVQLAIDTLFDRIN